MNDLHDALDRLSEEGVAGISLHNPADEGATRSAAQRGRGPVVLALAAALVLIAGIAGVLVLGDDGSDDPGESVVAGPDTGESPDDRDDDGEDDPAADDQTGVGGQGDVGGQSDDGTAGDGADGDAQLADALAAAVPAVLGGNGPSVSVPAAALPDGTRADLYDLDGARRGPTGGFGVVVVPALEGADRSFCLVMTDSDGSAVDIDGEPAAVCTSPAELVTDGWVGVSGDTGPRLAKGPWVVVGAVAPDVTGVEVDGAAVAFDGSLFIAVGEDAAEVRLVRHEQRAAFVAACDALGELLVAQEQASAHPADGVDRLIRAAADARDPAFALLADELAPFAGQSFGSGDGGGAERPVYEAITASLHPCRSQLAPGLAVVYAAPWPAAPAPSIDLAQLGELSPLSESAAEASGFPAAVLGPVVRLRIDSSAHLFRWFVSSPDGPIECLRLQIPARSTQGCVFGAQERLLNMQTNGAGGGERFEVWRVSAATSYVTATVDERTVVQQPLEGIVAFALPRGDMQLTFFGADGEVLRTRTTGD